MRALALLGLWLLACRAPHSGAQPRPESAPEAAPAPASPPSTAPPPPPAPRGSKPPADEALKEPLLPGLRGFCVHGGAPLVGRPLVDGAGRLYLVTRDGYLHAYEADGRFRYSFTVAGTPLGSPSLRASDGAVLLGTTARSVYGIGAEGQLSFRAQTLTPVWSGLHARDPESVVYVGLDRFLYALSNHGEALYRVPIPGQPVGEPAVAPGGVVYIPLDTGLARMEQALKVHRFPTAEPIDELGLGAHGPWVLSGGALISFDPRGVAWRHGQASALLADGRSVLALDGRGGGAWFPGGDPADRVVLGPHEPLEPSGEGGLSGTRALFPLESGEVALLDLAHPERPTVSRVAILHESVTLALFAARSRRLLLTGRSGRACLVDDPWAASRAPAGFR